MFGMKKNTTGVIDENIDGVVVFKCSNCVLKWVVLKGGRICALVCREPQIEMRVLFKGNTRGVLVTAKVPKNLCKWRTGTEFL